jgi:hypothetical protein
MDAHDYADATREELLLYAAEVVLAIRLGRTGTDDFVQNAERLARLVWVFDDWLAHGGPPPREWKK